MDSLTSVGGPAASASLGEATSSPHAAERMAVALLTGGIDKPYAYGLAMALTSRSVRLDFIGSEEIDSPDLHSIPSLRVLNLRGNQREDAPTIAKIRRILVYYARLIQYAAGAQPRVFHILWNNKFELFDRTLLLLYYRLCGRKIVLTAHNVNAGKRDANDSALNRLTLRVQYRLADHIFVHTDAMKVELERDFGVDAHSVTVIPLGINNSAPHTDLTPADARRQLGLSRDDRVILFFGGIGPYKGLETLVPAFQRVAESDPNARLLVVGKPKVGCEEYVAGILDLIRGHDSAQRVIQRLEFIPDAETETYFKASDVLVLPYTQVSQSGVLVLGYSFGVPVIAAAVGSLSEDVVEGRTGFLFKPEDSVDLAATIGRYFQSELYAQRSTRRHEIEDYASRRYSWDVVADRTLKVYTALTRRRARQTATVTASEPAPQEPAVAEPPGGQTRTLRVNSE